MTAIASIELGGSEEPGTPSKTPMQVAGAQAYLPRHVGQKLKQKWTSQDSKLLSNMG